MTIAELIAWFESWADPNWQEDWDNCGWQVEPEDLHQPARVLVCLTPTRSVLAEALQLQQQGVEINLIFAHHPLIFYPLKALQAEHPVGDSVRLALRQGLGIYTAHTNFDQVRGGVSDVLADRVGLAETQPVVSTGPDRGYGRVGKLNQPITLGNWLERIQKQLASPDLIISPEADLDRMIHKVAVLGGSGTSFLGDVSQQQAEVFLTSDCKFHQFQESRDQGLVLVDAGHYATERPACARLVEIFASLGVESVSLSDRDEDFRQFASSFNLAQFSQQVNIGHPEDSPRA